MSEKILNENPISVQELKKELAKIKKRDGELNFRAGKTEEYINNISVSKKSEEIEKKITELNIPRLKEAHIKKIVDIMPENVKDLKVVLQGYTLTINNDNSKKIIDVINKA